MSQQDLNAFADWLVANQSKKGTPEYDTVAKAFSELDTQNQDTSLSTAYQFGDKMVQANSADYTADLNQRMDDGFLGDMTRLGQEYIGNPIRNALGFDDIQQDKANRDFEASNRAKATKLRGEADALNYRSLTADDIDGVGSAINYGAQAVAESLPQMLPALANPTVGGALNMGIIMPGELNAELKEIEGLDDNTRMTLAASGGALMGALETLGVGILFKGVPTEVLGKMGVKRIAAALEKKGMGRVANRFVSGFAGEGVTEVGQNEISMAFEGLGGKDISDEEAYLRRRESFLKGGAAGGMIRGGGSAVAETASGIKNAATSPEIADDPEAASELANDLNRVANVDGYDLQNVNTGATTGARAAVDTLHAEYSSQIEFEFSELESKLGITKEDPRYEAFQKVKANTAKRKGKNKVKSRVDPSDFAILRDLTQGTEEGANLLKLLRKSNELSFLANQGLKGGLSQYFDVLNPLDTDGRYNIGRTVAAPISTLGAYGTMGASVLPAVAGRAVDAMTGRRSRVARYVRENQANPGIQVPTEPSLRDQDQEATANAERDALRVNNEERQTAEFLDSIDAPPAANPNNPSPQAQLEDATGFDKQTAIDVAAMIGNSNFYPEAIRRFATDYIASVRQGGNVGKKGEGGLSSLIRLMNRLADSDPENYPRANPQNQLAIQAAGGGGPTIMTRAAMQREQGRADNQAFNDELQAAVNADTSIDPQTKALVLSGLIQARKSLGSNPVEAVEAIYLDVATRAKNPQYADQYIMPYVERVTAQQQQQAATEQPAATEAPSSPGPIYRMAVPDFGEGQAVRPVPPLQSEKVLGQFDAEGQYVAMPQGEIISGNTYDGARIYINPRGFGGMEVDATQQMEGKADDKSLGRPFRTNLYKKFNTSKNGKKTMNLWNWSERPQGHDRGENDQEFLVAFVHSPKRGDPKKHYYTLDLQLDVPTTLDKDQSNIKAGDQPFLRPSGHGVMTLGNPVAKIRTSKGKEHTIYDTIRIEPKPNTPILRNQGPVLSLAPGTPLSTDTTARTGTAYGLLPYLRTVSGKTYDHPRKILAASNPKNAQQQIDNLDGLLIDHPNTLASPEAFTDYLSDAMGKANKDGSVPLIPYRALQMIQDPSIIEDQLLNLSEGQKSLAAEGFAAADSFKQAYAEGAATPAITGKLLLWGILSRGVSPFIQEGLFLDVVVGEGKTNIAPWIEAAAEGKFDVNAYLEWVKETVPEYSPGRGTTSNLNSFGKDLLRKMSVKDENGLTSMQKLHDLIANPELSGKDIRREFHKLNDKVGINNKVLSFILLVTGRQDVFVLDRVQMRNLFDDGTFGDFNLYDASKNEEGKAITGSNMAPLGDDTMGLLYYEALERDLAPVIKQVYEKLGRGDDFSIGRYHWESWVSQSFQEVDHGTIAGLLNESLGLENPFSGITTKEGRYNRFDSGAIYGYDDNLNQYVILPDGLGNSFKLTPEGANNVLKRVRLKSVKNVIVPKNFSVSESKDKPYYEQPEINREALSSVIQEEGGQLVTTGVPETSEGNPDVAGSGSRPEGVTYNRGPDIPPPGTNNGRRSDPGTVYQTSIAGSRPATPTESKAQQEPIKALFEIGKKGSPYEFGIKDMAEARKLAKALFHSLTLYKDKKSFEEALGGPAGSTRAFRMPDGDGPGQGGQIAVLDTGDALQNLFLALHEVGHPLEADYSPAYARSEPMVERNYYTSPNDGLERRGEIDTSDGLGGGFKTYKGTIRDFVATLQDGAAAFRSGRIKDKDTKQADAIVEEITNFQRFYKVGGTVPVREGYTQAQQAVSEGALTLSEAQDSITDYENEYLHMPYEMAADVIAAYLFDPRMAKREMPKTTAVLQVLFEGNPTVQLFSLPFASVLAVIMANMLIAEREEEEKKMPPPGALSLGQAPGALSI